MKRLKAFLIFVLAVIMCVACCLSISAEEVVDTNEAYEFAKEFLSEYYFAKDQYSDYDFSEFAESENLLNFINQKTISARHKYIVYETDDKQNYKLEFSLLEAKECDGSLLLDIAVKASFRYKYYDRNSSMGDETLVIVGYEDGKYVIKDWYTYLDSFDVFARGELATINDPNYWDSSLVTEELMLALEDESQRIYQYFTDMKAQVLSNNDEAEQRATALKLNSHRLNRAKVNYAQVAYGIRAQSI